MKYFYFFCLFSLSLTRTHAQVGDPQHYLDSTKKQLVIEWPKNRMINLVFHGHSVPAGYWANHEVHTLQSYPNLLLKSLKEKYPFAVINVIVTAIGGENAIKGATRFEKEVLTHQPDVLFIDYALNDRFSPIDQVRESWEAMIKQALAKDIKVVLLTPSPDQRLTITDNANALEPFVAMIRELADKYRIGLADPYAQFKEIGKSGALKDYMSQVNHPNEKGHQVILETLLRYF